MYTHDVVVWWLYKRGVCARVAPFRIGDLGCRIWDFSGAPAAKSKGRRTFARRPLLALAAIYSRGTCRPTTIDVLMFHFRVRNGTGWGHQAVTTRFRRCCGCVAPRAWVSVAGLGDCNVRQFPGRGGLASAWQDYGQFRVSIESSFESSHPGWC